MDRSRANRIISMTVSNIFALVGVLALYLLYVMFRGDKEEKAEKASKTEDPFVNFEREWAELKN
ncbi:hypothetical protein [Salipaludibacillus sp. CF4.18]|uniref:hypothetical protein n=1 Tax=Salipaludibacillus sp. CF4.18 TaxID=3373081 RepID=UPI003EE46DCA